MECYQVFVDACSGKARALVWTASWSRRSATVAGAAGAYSELLLISGAALRFDESIRFLDLRHEARRLVLYFDFRIAHALRFLMNLLMLRRGSGI